MKNFNPIAVETITIKFDCSCETEVVETLSDLPIANMYADNVADSENTDEYPICCIDCGKEYTCYVYVNMYEGNLEVKDENGNEVDVEIIDIQYSEEITND